MPVLLFITLFLLSFSGYAEGVVDTSRFEEMLENLGQTELSKQESIPREGAKIRILEFSSNRFVDMNIVSGQPERFKNFEILLKGCKANYQNTSGQDIAWLVFREELAGYEGEMQNVFSGWLLNTFPSASVFDHAKYDVKLLRCLAADEIPAVLEVPEVPILESENSSTTFFVE